MQNVNWKRVRVNRKGTWGVPPTNARGDKQAKTTENASKAKLSLEP